MRGLENDGRVRAMGGVYVYSESDYCEFLPDWREVLGIVQLAPNSKWYRGLGMPVGVDL